MEYEIKVEFNELAKSVTSNAKVLIKANSDEEVTSKVEDQLDVLKDLALKKAKEVFGEAMGYSTSKTVLKQ
jgi:hypothetical protein